MKPVPTLRPTPPTGSRPSRRRGLEFQLVPEDPLGRAFRLQLGHWPTRLLGLLALLATAGSVAGWATLPRALSGPRTERTLAVQSARRTQLGERLQALTTELEESARRVAATARRVGKAHRLMALPLPPLAEVPAPAADFDSIYVAVARRGRQLEAEVTAALARLERMLDDVERLDGQRPAWLAAVPSISPLGRSESVLVAGFGPRRNPYTQELDFHVGLDLAAPLGTPVLAPADGRVLFAGVFDRQDGEWWRLGRVVAIRHGERFLTIFGHCDGLLVKRGEAVRRGEQIATVGRSGWSTTVHLHYEVREGVGGTARAVDPRLHILDASWDDEESLFEGPGRPAPREGAPLPRALR